MLYFIIVWIILTLVCVVIGTALLNLVKADCFEGRRERFVITVWLGLIILCISLLATSLVLPLSTATGAAIALGLTACSLSSHQTRTQVLDLFAGLSPTLIIGFSGLAIAIAALTSQQIIWFDTGLYHLGSIKWLSEFGAVPGVALINPKFGFSSSWFALAAPLIPKSFGDRIGAITNGFIFLIVICQLLIISAQAFFGKPKTSDWFFVIFFWTVVAVYALTIPASPILISFSADVAVTFLIGVISWTILVVSEGIQRDITGLRSSPLGNEVLPLILSCGAVTIKLSALPLLPVSLLFYSFAKKKRINKIIAAATIIILLLSPLISYSIIASGCPLYPSQFMCLNLPWKVTAQNAIVETRHIQYWGKLVEEDTRGLSYMTAAFWNWLKGSTKTQIMTLLISASTILTIQTFKESNIGKSKKTGESTGKLWLITLGWTGILFIMIQGPLLRFGLGYFILIPSLFVAFFRLNHRGDVQIKSSYFWKKINKLYWKIFLWLIGFMIFFLLKDAAISRLFLPSELPLTVLNSERINDLEYTYPDNLTIRCWGADLPCAPTPLKDIKLRDPSQGIRAGFIQEVPISSDNP